jgi:predicted dehydrogenase
MVGNMKKVKIAMIGNWGHGSAMLGYIEKCKPEFAEITALGQISETETFDKTIETFEFLKGCPIYKDYRDLLREVKPDIAVVSTTLDKLSEATLNTAKAGCHIYAEKPIAATLEQLAAIRQAVEDNNKYLVFTMGNPASPQLRAIRELYDSGKMGTLAVVNARKSYPWNDNRVEQFPEKLGGTICWVGIHALEFIHSATGKLFSKVTGMQSNVRSADFASCPDNVVLSFELCGGGHASVSVDYCRPDGRPVYGDDWIRVVGTNAIAEANMSRQTLRITDMETENLSPALPPVEEWFELLPRAVAFGEQLDRCKHLTEVAFELNRTAIIAQKAVTIGKILEI